MRSVGAPTSRAQKTGARVAGSCTYLLATYAVTSIVTSTTSNTGFDQRMLHLAYRMILSE